MVSAVVFSKENDLEARASLTKMSVNSIKAAGVEPVVLESELVKTLLDTGSKYLHFVERGTIVLPDFYEAMIFACEDSGMDYAYCKCSKVCDEPRVVSVPSHENVVDGQLLVRRWVVEEIFKKGFSRKSMRKMLAEYRGKEVPHVLVIEVPE